MQRPANYDPSIDPTADQVRQLRDSDDGGPVVMLNLLKFRAQARYPADSGLTAASGAEAYQHYQRAFVIAVGATSQAEVLYDGPALMTFIGTVGSPEADWDKVLIVRYPSRKHFLAMMADETYRQALVHRYAGLERTVLIPCGG
jgi:uncharacterized protein (DUF1330 family)